MLVLSRKRNEKIVIDGNIRITVVGIRGNQVRIGLEAPDSVRMFREELCAHAGTSNREELTAPASAGRHGKTVGSVF